MRAVQPCIPVPSSHDSRRIEREAGFLDRAAAPATTQELQAARLGGDGAHIAATIRERRC